MQPLPFSICVLYLTECKVQNGKRSSQNVKRHTLLDYGGNLPTYINITDGEKADNKGSYDVPLSQNRAMVVDRHYHDFHLLNVWYRSA